MGNMIIEQGSRMVERVQSASQDRSGCDSIGIVVTIDRDMFLCGKRPANALASAGHINKQQWIRSLVIVSIEKCPHRLGSRNTAIMQELGLDSIYPDFFSISKGSIGQAIKHAPGGRHNLGLGWVRKLHKRYPLLYRVI